MREMWGDAVKFSKAFKKTSDNLSVGVSLAFDGAVHATKQNQYFIKNGIEALFHTVMFWLRALIIFVFLPFLFVYGMYHQLKKKV